MAGHGEVFPAFLFHGRRKSTKNDSPSINQSITFIYARNVTAGAILGAK